MRQFHELFAGREDVYGTYLISKAQVSDAGKRLGRGKTVTDGQVTEQLYQDHLDGKQSLGIVPIRLDNTVLWFAIDVDTYSTPELHRNLAQQIEAKQLPLVLCSSKSGGAHLFCFLTEPMSAVDARRAAKNFLKVLALPDTTEIFPKQDTITKSEAGSWINLPYFGETRGCLGPDGETKLTLKEFLIYSNDMAVHASDLDVVQKTSKKASKKKDSDDKEDAPPCIVTMRENGIEEGGRDNALAHTAVYLKKKFPDDWQEKLVEWNFEHCHPSLPMRDVSRIVSSTDRRDFQYLCKQSPMVGICDKTTCLKRKYGVGTGEQNNDALFSIDSIRKVGSIEPYYILVVDGKPIRMTSTQLLSYKDFKKAVFETHNKILPNIKSQDWESTLADAMQHIEYEAAPVEITAEGAIKSLFLDWTMQRIHGFGAEESLLIGQPYYDGKYVFFRGSDFLTHVKKQPGNKPDDRIVWLTLSEEGADQIEKQVKNRKLKVWRFPVGEPWFEVDDAENATI